jgi:predicted nuclease of restriction endonuclease-like (RecB) superfamily
MRQFYETYRDTQFVSTVLTQISWTNHLMILSKTKSLEEREFYIHFSLKEKYSSRELERQIDSGLFERVIMSKQKVSPLVTQIHPEASSVFKDSCVFDFIGLPEVQSERDLNKGIVYSFTGDCVAWLCWS